MSILTKTLLSIPSIIGIIYMLSFWNADFFKWVTNNVLGFEYQTPTVSLLIIFQIGYLIYRIWNYKNLEKKTKIEWTWILVVFNFLSSLFLIWKKDAELNKMNKNTVLKNV